MREKEKPIRCCLKLPFFIVTRCVWTQLQHKTLSTFGDSSTVSWTIGRQPVQRTLAHCWVKAGEKEDSRDRKLLISLNWPKGIRRARAETLARKRKLRSLIRGRRSRRTRNRQANRQGNRNSGRRMLESLTWQRTTHQTAWVWTGEYKAGLIACEERQLCAQVS